MVADLNDLDPDLCYFNHLAGNLNSPYYSERSLQNHLASLPQHSFSLMHSNVRSFFANSGDLLNTLESLRYDFSVLCLSETWLNSDNCTVAEIPHYNHSFCHRSNRCGGGVSIYVHENLPYSLRPDISIFNDHIESIFIEIDRKYTHSPSNIIIGCIYRPPKSSISDFNTLLQGILHSTKLENKTLFLLGDFNINLFNAPNHAHTSDFLDIAFSSSLFPIINKPTRITSTSATLIDNILCNANICDNISSGILATPVSDHCPIFCVTPFSPIPNTSNQYVMRRQLTQRNKLQKQTLKLDRTPTLRRQ